MIELGELLRERRIGNENDRQAAYSLIGYYTINGRWTPAQQDLADLLVKRWTDPANVKRLNLARFKARSQR